MPSAAGKRVGRVLAGCSKLGAGDKPWLPCLASDLRTRSLHRSAKTSSGTVMQSSDMNSSAHRTQNSRKITEPPFSSPEPAPRTPRIRLLFPWVGGSPAKGSETVEIRCFQVYINSQDRTVEFCVLLRTVFMNPVPWKYVLRSRCVREVHMSKRCHEF